MEQSKKISRQRRKELLRRLDSYTIPNKSKLYGIALLSWGQFLTRIISFYGIAKLFEQLYYNQPVNGIAYAGGIALLNGIGFFCAWLSKSYQGVVSQEARNRLKQQFFEAFEEQAQLDQHTTSDILTIASQGIDTLDTYYSVYINQKLKVYLNCATVFAIVAWIFPLGGLVFLVSLPFIPVSIILVQKRSKQIMQHYWATYMDVGNLFSDNLKGLNTLYTYQVDERYEAAFAQKAEAFRQSTMALLTFQLQSVGYMDGVMYVGVALSGVLAAMALSAGQLSLFSVIFFVLIATEFFMPIREAGYGMHLVMMNTKMADRIFTFLDEVSAKPQHMEAKTSTKTAIHRITLEQVSYGYDDTTLASDVTVTWKKGELFSICGVSGSGKSTLAKTLLQRHPLQDGEIYLDDIPISQWSKQELADDICYVSPEQYVFNDSIYANLCLGLKSDYDLSPEAMLDWLHQEKLLSFVEHLPQGLQTVAGENGQLLSPGQRQQILLVRAMLGQFSVYIFDEMTSSVDKMNETILFDGIKRLAERAIVIFISHKMKQVLQTERILFIEENGVTISTPNELLQTNAAFKTLWQTQEELEAVLHERA